MKKQPQELLIIGPNFFHIANWPKTSPNLNFCSIKLLTAQVMYNEFASIRAYLVTI